MWLWLFLLLLFLFWHQGYACRVIIGQQYPVIDKVCRAATAKPPDARTVSVASSARVQTAAGPVAAVMMVIAAATRSAGALRVMAVGLEVLLLVLAAVAMVMEPVHVFGAVRVCRLPRP